MNASMQVQHMLRLWNEAHIASMFMEFDVAWRSFKTYAYSACIDFKGALDFSSKNLYSALADLTHWG